ncbi:unnamed protein product [Amoebophrya sp. A25]|nr:unnamed protein product [Amoebophrya sp. A25]|eukprot:GSA25T00019637001.1
MAAFFESSMFIFVFLWTPALNDLAYPRSTGIQGEKHEDHSAAPYGLIFALFMVSCMCGSCLFSIFESQVSEKTLASVTIGLAVASNALVLCTTNVTVLLLGFMGFELSLGLYFPTFGIIKSRLVPERSRAMLYSFFRVPLNVIVVLCLAVDLPVRVGFGFITAMLVLCGYLLTGLRLDKHSSSNTPCNSETSAALEDDVLDHDNNMHSRLGGCSSKRTIGATSKEQVEYYQLDAQDEEESLDVIVESPDIQSDRSPEVEMVLMSQGSSRHGSAPGRDVVEQQGEILHHVQEDIDRTAQLQSGQSGPSSLRTGVQHNIGVIRMPPPRRLGRPHETEIAGGSSGSRPGVTNSSANRVKTNPSNRHGPVSSAISSDDSEGDAADVSNFLVFTGSPRTNSANPGIGADISEKTSASMLHTNLRGGESGSGSFGVVQLPSAANMGVRLGNESSAVNKNYPILEAAAAREQGIARPTDNDRLKAMMKELDSSSSDG